MPEKTPGIFFRQFKIQNIDILIVLCYFKAAKRNTLKC